MRTVAGGARTDGGRSATAQLFRRRQYHVGDSMLVAPVCWEDLEDLDIYLPAGSWVDAWTGSPHDRPASVRRAVPWHEIPAYLRAERVTAFTSFRPSGPDRRWTIGRATHRPCETVHHGSRQIETQRQMIEEEQPADAVDSRHVSDPVAVAGNIGVAGSVAVAGSVSTTGSVAVVGSAATAGSVAVAGSAATAGSVAVAGSAGTAGSVAVAGSAGTIVSIGVIGSLLTIVGVGIRNCVATVACIRCRRCIACVACIDCVDCVGCIGCVGLRGAVGRRNVRALT